MKTTKRVLALLLVLAVSVLILAGCAAKGITVHVKITGQDAAVMYDKDVKVTAETPFAIDATVAAMKDGKLDYTDENGFISSIGGVAGTDTDGWLMFINGEMAQLGASEQPVAEGDTLEWQYLNYAEAFPQQ